MHKQESAGENSTRGDAMRRKAKKEQPGCDSPPKNKMKVFFLSLQNNVPPAKDIVVLVVLTIISFSSGFFVGKGTVQPMVPKDFVSIREIDVGVDKNITFQDPETCKVADKKGTEKNENKDLIKDDKLKEIHAVPVAVKDRDKDAGVVGPVPVTRKVKSEVVPKETVQPSIEKMIIPVQGRIISEFGWRKHPVFKDWRYHTGVDIQAPEGSLVNAVLSGKVVELANNRELGQYIVMEHADNIKTKYAHLKSSSVNYGESVKQGQAIGSTGTSGITSGSYLHFEVISKDKAIDPRKFLGNRL